MWEALQPIFNWHADSWLGNLVSGSTWLFPALETVHILAMAIMLAGIFIINIRLVGLGMSDTPVAILAKTLNPYINWGLVLMTLSGYGMFASEADKSFYNDGFKFKMAAFVLVVIFQYTIYRSVTKRPDADRSFALGAMVAFTSFVLWFCVSAGGRAIGFV